VREMPPGLFPIVRLDSLTWASRRISQGGRAPFMSDPCRCAALHRRAVELVASGTATAAFDDGTVGELRRGALVHTPARPHVSWVVGGEPCVSLHFPGADHDAKERGAANDEGSMASATRVP
jgi:hypothetical protein